MRQAHRERNSWIYSWESRWFSIFSWSCWWSQKHCKNSGMPNPLLENQIKTVVTRVSISVCSFVLNLIIGTWVLCTSLLPFFWHTTWYRYLLMLFKCPEQSHSSADYEWPLMESFIRFLLCLPKELLKIMSHLFQSERISLPSPSVPCTFLKHICLYAMLFIYLHYSVSPLL